MYEDAQTVPKTATDAAKERDVGEVLSSLGKLEGVANSYSNLIDELQGRLNSVLSPIPPAGVEEKGTVKEPTSCELVSRINSIYEVINSANDANRSIASRLQL